ncbi:LPS export ABC transporter periplasmic protein LptC [Sphingomonas antarctica]|uniref:LPS export ABC transporter periplasmic protein LptC n=1 Tax=Sphingomonas antarctica TaxID=2040274 RepID=UPI0039E93197
MSELAIQTRDTRRVWARPGGSHDRMVRTLNRVLPVFIGALVAVLVVAPLAKRNEISFVLAKDKVDMAKERMRLTRATYRGEDDQGRPFSLDAGSGVQASSKVPVVQLNDLSARIVLDDGPGVLRAPAAHYNMDQRQLQVDGPMTYQSQGGYRLETRDVMASLAGKSLSSDKPVQGKMPLGAFSGNRMSADLNSRTVILSGGARLHIVQGAAKGR